MQFQLESDFKPTGDQPQAIEQLVKGIHENEKYQVLLGVRDLEKLLPLPM